MSHLIKSEAWKNPNPCRAVEEEIYLKEDWLGDLPGDNPKGYCHFEHAKPCRMDCRFYIHDFKIKYRGIIGGTRTGMTQAGAYEALEFLTLSTKQRTGVN